MGNRSQSEVSRILVCNINRLLCEKHQERLEKIQPAEVSKTTNRNFGTKMASEALHKLCLHVLWVVSLFGEVTLQQDAKGGLHLMLPAPLAPGFVTKHPGQNCATLAAAAALYLHSLAEGRKKILHVLEMLWSEKQALMLQALQPEVGDAEHSTASCKGGGGSDEGTKPRSKLKGLWPTRLFCYFCWVFFQRDLEGFEKGKQPGSAFFSLKAHWRVRGKATSRRTKDGNLSR